MKYIVSFIIFVLLPLLPTLLITLLSFADLGGEGGWGLLWVTYVFQYSLYIAPVSIFGWIFYVIRSNKRNNDVPRWAIWTKNILFYFLVIFGTVFLIVAIADELNFV